MLNFAAVRSFRYAKLRTAAASFPRIRLATATVANFARFSSQTTQCAASFVGTLPPGSRVFHLCPAISCYLACDAHRVKTMPPKGSKRAVKASTVAVVNGEDAQQSTLINEPKKRAPARPAKRAAAATGLFVFNCSMQVAIPLFLFGTDASPVEDEAAQPLIDEPKKKRVARPAKTAAFDGSYLSRNIL